MKFVKTVCLLVLYPFLMLVTGFFTGFMSYPFFYPEYRPVEYVLSAGDKSAQKEQLTQQPTQQPTQQDTLQKAEQGNKEGLIVKEEDKETVSVAGLPERLSADTEYLIVKNDLTKQTTEEESIKLPHKYIGMNREQFLDAMESFAAGPPLSEREKGFAGLQVLSFSKERVVVRMDYQVRETEEQTAQEETDVTAGAEAGALAETIQEPGDVLEREDGYYLAVYDGEVVVYKADRKTKFFGTGIRMEVLPKEVQEQIIGMLWIAGDEELVGFLESYSS